MKSLSIQQPWAWLIVNSYKDIENRSWPTNVRGDVLIHAGKKFDDDGYIWIRRTFPDIPIPEYVGAFALGGIVGRAMLTDCIERTPSGKWFFGPYGFVFKDAKPLPFRPLRGQLGFFDVPDAEYDSKPSHMDEIVL